MRIAYRIIVLFMLLTCSRALSQAPSSSMSQYRINDSTSNILCSDTSHASNFVSRNNSKTANFQTDSDGVTKSVISNKTKQDLDFWSFIITIVGIVTAIGTLWWMIINSKRENKNFLNQLDELKKQNQKADKQILNQEKEYRDASERSRKLNTALKENVAEIKDYLTKNDLMIKLKEKKDGIYGTFKALWNSSLTKSASNVKDGSVVQNPAVMKGIITITKGITAFRDLMPNMSDSCEEACKACIDDIEQLSKKKKKGDITEWLKGMKKHFEDMEKEMSSCIDNL